MTLSNVFSKEWALAWMWDEHLDGRGSGLVMYLSYFHDCQKMLIVRRFWPCCFLSTSPHSFRALVCVFVCLFVRSFPLPYPDTRPTTSLPYTIPTLLISLSITHCTLALSVASPSLSPSQTCAPPLVRSLLHHQKCPMTQHHTNAATMKRS